MKAPLLDRRITIQTPSTSRGADGSVVEGWTAVATVWANRKDVPSARRGEMVASEQFNDTLFTEFTIRYRAGITGKERVTDEYGFIGNVVGLPSMIGRKQYLVLVTERGVRK